VAEITRGSVTDRPWGRTLAALGLRGVTGQLTLVADAKRFVVAFDRGAVVAAVSPLASDAAVRVALTGHLVSSSQVPEISRRQAAAPHRDEIEVIAELARLGPEHTLRLRRRVIAQRAARTFSPDHGEFLVTDDSELAITPGCELDLRAVIYMGARANLSEQRLACELDDLGSWFRLKPALDDDLPQFGFGDVEQPVVERLRDGGTIDELEAFAASFVDGRTVRAVVYALAAYNACDVEPPRPATARPRRQVTPATHELDDPAPARTREHPRAGGSADATQPMPSLEPAADPSPPAARTSTPPQPRAATTDAFPARTSTPPQPRAATTDAFPARTSTPPQPRAATTDAPPVRPSARTAADPRVRSAPPATLPPATPRAPTPPRAATPMPGATQPMPTFPRPPTPSPSEEALASGSARLRPLEDTGDAAPPRDGARPRSPTARRDASDPALRPPPELRRDASDPALRPPPELRRDASDPALRPPPDPRRDASEPALRPPPDPRRDASDPALRPPPELRRDASDPALPPPPDAWRDTPDPALRSPGDPRRDAPDPAPRPADPRPSPAGHSAALYAALDAPTQRDGMDPAYGSDPALRLPYDAPAPRDDAGRTDPSLVPPLDDRTRRDSSRPAPPPLGSDPALRRPPDDRFRRDSSSAALRPSLPLDDRRRRESTDPARRHGSSASLALPRDPSTARAGTAPVVRPPFDDPEPSTPEQVILRVPSSRPPPRTRQVASTDTPQSHDVKALIAQRLKLLDHGADHFKLLGVTETASPDALRKAYFALARQLHPDRLAALGISDDGKHAQRLFAQINSGFAILSDQARRARYVDVLRRGGEAAVRAEQARAEELAGRILEAEEAFRRGERALRRDQPQAAIAELEVAIRHNPDEADYHALLAWAQFCAAPDKQAVAAATRALLDQAIQRAPRAVAARFYLGRVERMLGRDQEALRHFREVLAAVPGHSDAAAEVRVIEARLGGDDRPGGGLFGRKR
jgi:hypothetical protein